MQSEAEGSRTIHYCHASSTEETAHAPNNSPRWASGGPFVYLFRIRSRALSSWLTAVDDQWIVSTCSDLDNACMQTVIVVNRPPSTVSIRLRN